MEFKSFAMLQLFPHLIGKKGSTKSKVEQDTGTTITIPRKNSTAAAGSKHADVVVQGLTPSAAARAATRLALIVDGVLNTNK